MQHKSSFVKFILYLFFIAGAIGANGSDGSSLPCLKSMDIFLTMKNGGKLEDGLAMNDLFLSFNETSDVLLKSLSLTIKEVKRELKALKKSYKDKHCLKERVAILEQLKKYVKKYRINNDVFVFYRRIKNCWDKFTVCINNGDDILDLLPTAEVLQTGKDGLKELISVINKDRKMIDRLDDKLHANWIDQKLANYVLKIELTRIHNKALFHPVYSGISFKTGYPS